MSNEELLPDEGVNSEQYILFSEAVKQYETLEPKLRGHKLAQFLANEWHNTFRFYGKTDDFGGLVVRIPNGMFWDYNCMKPLAIGFLYDNTIRGSYDGQSYYFTEVSVELKQLQDYMKSRSMPLIRD